MEEEFCAWMRLWQCSSLLFIYWIFRDTFCFLFCL